MDTVEAQKAAVLGFRKAFRDAPNLTPIHKLQEHAARPRPLKGQTWVSNVDIPALASHDDEHLRAKLWEVFQSRGDGTEKLDYPAASVPLHGEWIGHRKATTEKETHTDQVSEQERFAGMQHDCGNNMTIFYLSGAGWMRSGPPGSRPLTRQLSQYSGSRVFTMSHRLAPQYTLPTLIWDALVGYLYLIAPPKSATHEPVHPSNLILAGESGGSTLHLAVLQFIQHLSLEATAKGNIHPTIQLNNQQIPLQMPRGCAFISPPCDLTSALPAAQRNEHIDWMPERGPWFRDDFPADSLWPSNPPRAEIYVDATTMRHPLIQPSSWRDWRGAPPMWVACGQERYADGIKYFVKNLRESDVPVQFYEYEYMVHSFPLLLPFMPQSKHCMKLWGIACKEIGLAGYQYTSRANFVALGTLETREMTFPNLSELSEDEVARRMQMRIEVLKHWVWKGPKIDIAKI